MGGEGGGGKRTLALWYEIGGGQADAQEGQAGLGLIVHHCLLLLHTDACAEHGLPCLGIPVVKPCLQGDSTRAAQGLLQQDINNHISYNHILFVLDAALN